MCDDRIVIRFDGRVVGVAVRVRGGFMFFSSDPNLKELEAKIFSNAKAVGRRVAEFSRKRGETRTTSVPQIPALSSHSGRYNSKPVTSTIHHRRLQSS